MKTLVAESKAVLISKPHVLYKTLVPFTLPKHTHTHTPHTHTPTHTHTHTHTQHTYTHTTHTPLTPHTPTHTHTHTDIHTHTHPTHPHPHPHTHTTAHSTHTHTRAYTDIHTCADTPQLTEHWSLRQDTSCSHPQSNAPVETGLVLQLLPHTWTGLHQLQLCYQTLALDCTNCSCYHTLALTALTATLLPHTCTNCTKCNSVTTHLH